MLIGSTQEDNISIVSISASNIRVPKYREQALIDLNGNIYCDTIIAGDFNHVKQWIDHQDRKSIRKH
jgi:hypothetical protein